MNYFNGKAIEILNEVLDSPEFYSEDDVNAVARALKEVARDQRHACADAVGSPDLYVGECARRPGAASKAHDAAMNACIQI